MIYNFTKLRKEPHRMSRTWRESKLIIRFKKKLTVKILNTGSVGKVMMEKGCLHHLAPDQAYS